MLILSIFEWLVSLLDPAMAVWVVVVMVLGYWLKRTTTLPSWLPPLPIILFAAYMAVGLLFGLISNTADGWRGVAYVVAYALGNALLYTGLAFIVYDIAHALVKRRAARKAGGAGDDAESEA